MCNSTCACWLASNYLDMQLCRDAVHGRYARRQDLRCDINPGILSDVSHIEHSKILTSIARDERPISFFKDNRIRYAINIL